MIAGFVGPGMLTASVSGSIFASPPSSNISQAIRLVAAESAGVLLIVPNYTGDVLNFGLAAETVATEGIMVESVVVGEDVAAEVLGSSSKAGKRGTCGLILVLKVAGYFAEMGKDLAEVKELALESIKSMGSMGLCVAACSKPGVGRLFHLDRDEVELGVGVHGEAGVSRLKMLSAQGAVKILLDSLLKTLEIKEEDEVVALVNNLGSLSYMEQWVLAGELEKQLSCKNIRLSRLYAGSFFTSINMAGVQICIMKINQDHRETLLQALDFPALVPAWQVRKSLPQGFRLTPPEGDFLKRCLIRISEDLIRQESRLNYLDSSCGDGDSGSTFARLALLLRERMATLDFCNPAQLFLDLSLAVEESVGGTSGAIYALLLKSVSTELQNWKSFMGRITLAKCWRAGVEGIKKYSSARLGDKTMLDSLEEGCETFEESLEQQREANVVESFRCAVRAAEEGCKKTKSMKAFAGRASYTDGAQQKNVDAGAYAVTIWLSAIQKVVEEE